MCKAIVLAFLIHSALCTAAFSAPLTETYQADIITRMEKIRGAEQSTDPISGAALHPFCGMSTMLEAHLNHPNMTGVYKTRLEELYARPVLPQIYISPAGHFLIHYATSGNDIVYQPYIDTINGGDGVPDYINFVGLVADSIWAFEIDSLGFPAPPSDGFYPEGEGTRYDIYMSNIHPTFAAYASVDYELDSQTATSFIVIDNKPDTPPYTGRPLDAVRTVLAHEFFHAIQFGMDYSESESIPTAPALYWFETSATWMEKTAYPNIDLYQMILSYFFDCPWISLQDFSTSRPLHPYASVVFPIYLTEKWDDSLSAKYMGTLPRYGRRITIPRGNR